MSLCLAYAQAPVLLSEAQINTDGNAVDGNTSPSITPLPGGRFIVAWHDGGPTSGWGRLYANDGTALGGQFSLDPYGSGWQYGHVVAALPSGGIAAFWGYDSGAVLGQQFDSDFNALGGELTALNANAWPEVASLANGNPVLVATEPYSTTVQFVLFDSSLNPGPVQTANINPAAVGVQTAVAAAPNGNFTVAWANAAGNVIMRTFDSNGNAVTGELVVNSSAAGSGDAPSLAYTSSGELWVGWSGSQCCVYMRHFASDGAPIGAEFTVNEDTLGGGSPQLAVGPDGTVAISWTDTDSDGDGVFARVFNPNGSPLTNEFEVNQYTAGDQDTGWAGGKRGALITDRAYVFTWYGTGSQGQGVYMTAFGLLPMTFPAGDFTLTQGASIAVGSLALVMQGDGNLVLYQPDGTAIWDTGTYGQDCGSSQCHAIFQADGNLVVYNGSTALWNSGTFGNPGAELMLSAQAPQLEVVGSNGSLLWSNILQFSAGTFKLAQGASFAIGSLNLVMQGDGNLVLYQPDGTAVWSTGTFGQNCGSKQCFATFQGDGNFVVYNGSTPLWNSGTYGNSGAQLLLSAQTPQVEITGSDGSVLWSNLQFGGGTFRLRQGASFAIGSLSLVMQGDGNLVLYGAGGIALWNTGTYGQDCGSDQCFVIFQSDGNFVVYNGSRPLWNSGTFGNPGAELVLSAQAPQLEIIGSNQLVLWAIQ